MQFKAGSPEEYISQLPEDRKQAISNLREVLRSNLPDGIEEVKSSGMIDYVVPHRIYPKGYHVNPAQPLPFMSIASQKNHIAVYHMGMYADKDIIDWFVKEYSKRVKTKLDIGKSCIRFKNVKLIPYDLIGELCRKMTIEEYIRMYEAGIKS